jgi:hypothetical protein
VHGSLAITAQFNLKSPESGQLLNVVEEFGNAEIGAEVSTGNLRTTFFPAFSIGRISAFIDGLVRAAGMVVMLGGRFCGAGFFVNRFGAVSTLLAAFFSLMLNSRFLLSRKSSDAASIEVMTW